ncbi:MAG: SAM-dependent chlorinase/fluorinase [Desulfurococcales archaeon]|nr:SAM-dependent chlorinase/fluorinase [Desulfurococcales archaeon]
MALVGLVTDFGWGVYDGVLRALARCLGVDAVDIDHSVPSFSPLAGAYVLYNTIFWLPRGSGVAVVVDPGVGSRRRALLIAGRRYFISAPDNGVAYPAALEDGIEAAYALDPERVLREARRQCEGPPWGWRLSATFHGRDVFLPAAALAVSGVEPSRLGVEVDAEELTKLSLEYSRPHPEGEELLVLYVDSFGNVALSTRKLPAGDALLSGPRGDLRARRARTFSDVPPGEGLLYINSFGFLEAAVNQGSAAEKLGVSPGDRILVRPL